MSALACCAYLYGLDKAVRQVPNPLAGDCCANVGRTALLSWCRSCRSRCCCCWSVVSLPAALACRAHLHHLNKAVRQGLPPLAGRKVLLRILNSLKVLHQAQRHMALESQICCTNISFQPLLFPSRRTKCSCDDLPGMQALCWFLTRKQSSTPTPHSQLQHCTPAVMFIQQTTDANCLHPSVAANSIRCRRLAHNVGRG